MGQAMAVFYSRSLKSFEGVESSLETAWETRVPIEHLNGQDLPLLRRQMLGRARNMNSCRS